MCYATDTSIKLYNRVKNQKSKLTKYRRPFFSFLGFSLISRYYRCLYLTRWNPTARRTRDKIIPII